MMTRRPTATEEHALIARAQAGDQAAMETLIGAQEGIVRKVVKRVWSQYTTYDFDDLMQMGRLAIWTAVMKFDLSTDYRLSTYSYQWIRAAMGRALQFDAAIRIPAHVLEKTPYEERDKLPHVAASLDHLCGKQEDTHLHEFIPADVNVEEDVLRHEEIRAARETIEPLLERLTPAQRQTIWLFYGLDGHGKRTLAEVAELTGMSREGVRQRITSALTRMRFLAARDGEPIPPTLADVRREEILRRRAAGDTYPQIAKDLGIKRQTAADYVKRARRDG